jgi:hypothetical protein
MLNTLCNLLHSVLKYNELKLLFYELYRLQFTIS